MVIRMPEENNIDAALTQGVIAANQMIRFRLRCNNIAKKIQDRAASPFDHNRAERRRQYNLERKCGGDT